MPRSQSWLGSPDPLAPNAPEQSQPHHRDWGQHHPQDSPPGLTWGVYGVYSVLARGFAVPQTPLEGDTAQLEGIVPWGHCPVLSPPSSLEPPSPRAGSREVPWARSALLTHHTQKCSSTSGVHSGRTPAWKRGGSAPLWGLGGTGKGGCHTTSDICDLLCTELGLFPFQNPFPPALSALPPMSQCLLS